MNILNVYLVGTGNIGATLLSQISKKNNNLQKTQNKKINIIALADNEKYYFQKSGITLNNWKRNLKNSNNSQDLKKFITEMKNDNQKNKIFVDCTSSTEISNKYSEILKSGISIVTPNKKANSDSYTKFIELKKIAKNKKVKFLYETNVGAGLPIINTLTNLINGGDKITKIEAILSGTISYIFNNFNGNKKFSEIIVEAKNNGYTEPDPRDDLNGMDIARKILILARICGEKYELNDIKIKSLINKKCEKAKTIDEFLNILKEMDDNYEKLKVKAKKENKVLRYIATLNKGKINLELKLVNSSHPFFNLSGTDNIISISTESYNETPLIIRGPGAGAEVTALGVYCDIINCI